ncbi:2'-5' RNA ligase superfamily protein [Motilibacter rhizosphaerae]|uniref:2'-5' RNA ligase superfamily protein n=1 Tax=Motilibacter rhizosphaerae TaxID=598652 RepID=A0A4Q7NWM1_9ACTN|nr:2'-5' RNA ligase family protein [Motilibacter rhizosphaerae]RZS91713.1 2'-5' RNA ligase superfamily protein [Motilibacter rhizosphaerae]
MSTAGREPLVVTLELADPVQELLDGLRRRWFPADRLVVGAHLTLFHALPGELLAEVLDDLRETAPEVLPLEVTGPVSLGRGVAVGLRSQELAAWHRELQRRWTPWLTRQDAALLRAHVTVQNKVDPAVARATLDELRGMVLPETAEGSAVAVWHYLGGPWAPAARVPLGATR